MSDWVFRAKRFGIPGCLGAALCLIAAWMMAVKRPAIEEHADRIDSMSRRLRYQMTSHAEPDSKLGPRHAAGTAPRLTAEHAWAALWESLPAERRVTDLRMAFLRSPAEYGLALSGGQFTLEQVVWAQRQHGEGLCRQRMLLPMTGQYASVRNWVDALRGIEGLSLDALDIQRTDPTGEAVKVQARASLWWKAAGGCQ